MLRKQNPGRNWETPRALSSQTEMEAEHVEKEGASVGLHRAVQPRKEYPQQL